MRSAFNRDNSLIDAAAKGCTVNAIRAMMLESEVRTNPAMRADRFVEDWRKLADRERAYRDTFDNRRAAKVRGSMATMAKSLERDPQIESLVRQRLPEIGIRISRSEEHTSELQSLMRISYAVFCLKKKTQNKSMQSHTQ